ncbi:MAG TPA: hypothetical protein VMB79_11295 [Jatrophihabitans sp.]|nr:hypothetical protein [Jatrophihabitans sp.]
MAYLNPVRLAFAGRFQADVSTVNNDVRHYDDATFIPSFQELQTPTEQNGWWNPTGSGAYRFVDCRITGAGYADGSWVSNPEQDRAVGLVVAGAGDRTAGKLVDLDPQWQVASAPWGLAVRLLSGGDQVLAGEYKSNAFRDLWFSRMVTNPPQQGDAIASATFQSVLEGVVFDEAMLTRSQVLRELQAATSGDRLSIRFATFGYDGSATSPTFTLGTMIGTIGPYLDGEPESFVFGRRFAPASGFSSYGANVTYFSGLLDGASKTLLLDLSNALQTSDARGTQLDIGTLSAGVLTDDTVLENTPVTADNAQVFGEIDYLQADWLQKTGGVVALPLTDDQFAVAQQHPLALFYDAPFNPGGNGEGEGLGVVAIRETLGGLLVEAEPVVHRIDAGDSSPVTFWGARYGEPLDDQQLAVRQLGSIPGQGGSGAPDPKVDNIPIPNMGVPEAALTVPTGLTLSKGQAQGDLVAGNPDNPRGYLDGQVYLVDFRLPGQGNNNRQPFDFVAIHVRDAFVVPEHPTWADVQPVLTQFGNLYPIMSKGFIDLSNEASVLKNRQLLLLAFTRPVTDPNYMPVTRDLSEPKRQMLIKYLSEPVQDIQSSAEVPGHRPVGTSLAAAAPAQPADPYGDGPVFDSPVDSKTRFAENFLRAGRGSQSS